MEEFPVLRYNFYWSEADIVRLYHGLILSGKINSGKIYIDIRSVEVLIDFISHGLTDRVTTLQGKMNGDKDAFLDADQIFATCPALMTTYYWEVATISSLVRCQILDGFFLGKTKKYVARQESLSRFLKYMSNRFEQMKLSID